MNPPTSAGPPARVPFGPLSSYREYQPDEMLARSRAFVNEPVGPVVTGYPAEDARVPRLSRKPLADIATFR